MTNRPIDGSWYKVKKIMKKGKGKGKRRKKKNRRVIVIF
jgi:hypothetical protein